jgi:transcription antitermination factor NusG
MSACAQVVQIPVASRQGSWFALHVRSRHDKLVAANLRVRGMEPLLPLYRSRRRWSDRTRVMDLPLFPGYVFCRFNPEMLLPILMTPGVVRVVSASKRPCPVAEEEIAAIQRIVSSGSTVEPWPYLQTGQKVRILDGPLFGIEGILLDVKNRRRLVVSVHLLQRSVAVEVDRECIGPPR